MKMLAIDLERENRLADGYVQVYLPGHGLFTGKLSTVQEYERTHTKSYMVNYLHDAYSDLFTKRQLRTYSTFVLALILNQE